MISNTIQSHAAERATTVVATAGLSSAAIPDSWWGDVSSLAIEATPVLGAIWLILQITTWVITRAKKYLKNGGENEDSHPK